MAVIVDTGVLLAAADSGDADHEQCAELRRAHRGGCGFRCRSCRNVPGRLNTIWVRLPARFLRPIITSELNVVDLTADCTHCIELIEIYADLGLGLVDASVITVANELGATTVATLYRRVLAVVRPSHVASLDLIP